MKVIVIDLVIFATFISPASSFADDPSNTLKLYLWPQPGMTYVYQGDNSAPRNISTFTVAGAIDKSGILTTCSPASSKDYPANLIKMGAQPILSKLIIRDNALISIRGRTEDVLLKLPLRPSSGTWNNQSVSRLPNGTRQVTSMRCGIASVGKRAVFGSEHSTVTVQCMSFASETIVKSALTYAENIGAIEEITEFFDSGMKLVGKTQINILKIRDGAADCTKLVRK